MGRAIEMENKIKRLEQRVVRLENILEELSKPKTPPTKSKRKANNKKSEAVTDA